MYIGLVRGNRYGAVEAYLFEGTACFQQGYGQGLAPVPLLVYIDHVNNRYRS